MALTCEARHAFAYTGHLTDGFTLRQRAIAPRLSSGRAWGAAVAAWHAFSGVEGLFASYAPALAGMAAQGALRASYEADAGEQAGRGVWVDPADQALREIWIGEILDHYMATAERLPNLTRLEGEIDVAIPSRTGRRGSTRYRFGGRIDGFTVDENEHQWTVEFKFRDSLTAPDQLQLSRQVPWYAWSHQQRTGLPVVGGIIEERLTAAPKPARIVKGKKKDTFTVSHAKDQLTTPELYIAACEEFDVDPHDDVVEHLGNRQWSQRYPILFGARELKESGQELVSAAKLIRDLDSGARYPIRNAQPQLCRGCRFFAACPNPQDRLYLETLYEYTTPKRLKGNND